MSDSLSRYSVVHRVESKRLAVLRRASTGVKFINCLIPAAGTSPRHHLPQKYSESPDNCRRSLALPTRFASSLGSGVVISNFIT